MKKEKDDENDVTITIEQSDVNTQSAPQKQSKVEERGCAEGEQDEEMNGYSESEDSDDEGQLRIAEEDNYASPEVGVVDNYYTYNFSRVARIVVIDEITTVK